MAVFQAHAVLAVKCL